MLLWSPPNDDAALGRAIMRLLGLVALPYGAFCMIAPCTAANMMVNDAFTIDCDKGNQNAVVVGITSWLGFFFSALMLFGVWASYQPCDIKPLLKIFGAALIVDGVWVKYFVMHKQGNGAFKLEHSLVACFVDTLLGVLLLVVASRSSRAREKGQ